jgi:multimeric flavodoxin WrbA
MKIIIISGSPKKDGNTDTLIRWLIEGATSNGVEIETVHAASLKLKVNGCSSCRSCSDRGGGKCLSGRARDLTNVVV